MLKNLIYIPYYIIKTPRATFIKNVKYLSKKEKKYFSTILFDIIKCSVVHSTSFMDYFLLRFFNKTEEERKEYAGTGFMYEYQLKMNPIHYRKILSDKVEFFKHYNQSIGREWYILSEFSQNRNYIIALLQRSKKIVLKDSKGQAGKEVEVINSMDYESLISYMNQRKFDLIEEFVYQHYKLQKLAPRGLNTIRIITQINKNKEVDIIGTILRLSIDSNTDNLSVGNAAASIDLKTGIVDRKAVYGDFTKKDIDVHPISGVRIVGFKIPFWEECIQLVKNAALHSLENKSIGWDVAVTDNGPILIEGNHNWGRTLWQLPVNKGLKKVLDQYV